MVQVFGGQGVFPSSRGVPSPSFSLSAGQAFLIPAGTWAIDCGLYATIEKFDQLTNIWRHAGDQGRGMSVVISDGVNMRVCNRTGCAAGALLTNAGSGYTSAPTVTASAGASVWQAIMGALVNTSVTVLTGGANYVYPPQIIIGAPGGVGIQATATCALTAGAVSSITVTNQGGGYLTVPSISITPDARDITGNGASAAISLTGQGTVNGVVCTDHGTPLTALPTLAFSGGGGSSAAATTIMDFSLTGYTVGTAGAVVAAPVQLWGLPAVTAGTAAYTNPQTQTGIVNMRQGSIIGAVSAGALTATGLILQDGGHYETVPSMMILQSGVATTFPIATAAVGGNTANVLMLAI